ncbi:PREDICTED: uncharacterized protein LOC108966005 [Bactrocera latifrons]|uniref:uncharacterized protein LOC108966005 n=1 Tax=Bactrocera latifrons TaxID=174628 RepID=UPI0008DC60F6|nr:PREDICTED: uncharacterized protein LOC108966005 [Bactrocera latifrons]
MINDLLKNDIIQRSEYASPVVIVKKKNGNDRLCIDYRRLNKLIIRELFPLPSIEECLQKAARYKYFTTLDLNSGYYQIEIEPESRKYTSFVTTGGLYEFKRMPFGLKNAPLVFQRLMSKIQEKVTKDNMIHYMDDILICSNTYEEMFRKLTTVLEILKEAIVHRQGRRKEHVDALSRCPNESAKETDVTLRVDKVSITSDDWLLSMQLQDNNIKQIVEKIKNKDKQILKEFCIEKDRLFRIEKEKKLRVVPKALRHKMLEECHDKNGHLGFEETVNKMKTYIWFPRMRNFVKSYLKACAECAYNKRQGGKIEGQHHFDNIIPIPFKTVHMDHLGSFIKSTKRNEHILVIVDAFTKYTIIKAVKCSATRHVLETLREVTSYFGVPERIATDRGTNYE